MSFNYFSEVGGSIGCCVKDWEVVLLVLKIIALSLIFGT
ncbi:hypothetical protein wTpre_378 [Wolbachia endosymbiont of Trichogramma pretiosum]|nr:hypothetical protein wTpre_378 [Wolbachia endosymbiont of Trichogramma pretiosum]